MKKVSKQFVFKTVLLLLSITMLIISCIFLHGLPKIIILLSIILFSSLGVIISSIDYHEHEAFFKILTVTLALSSLVLITYIILDKTQLLAKFQDAEALLEFIRGTKHWGVIVFILLVILEIIMLPIPGAVTAFIGSKLFGPTLGFIYITAGTIIGSIICFFLGKIFGKKLVIWMLGKEKTEKYSDLVNKKGRFVFILMLLFPFFPDDILCLVAGISTMSFGFFILAVCLARPIMIAFMCYFVEGSIIPFSGWGIPVWIAIFCILVVLFLILGKVKNHIMNKYNKPKEIKKKVKKGSSEKS